MSLKEEEKEEKEVKHKETLIRTWKKIKKNTNVKEQLTLILF